MSTDTNQTAVQLASGAPAVKKSKIDAEIEAARVKLKQLEARKAMAEAALRKKENEEARKNLDHKKYLVGAWALSTMTDEQIRAAMSQYLKGERERALFSLPPASP